MDTYSSIFRGEFLTRSCFLNKIAISQLLVLPIAACGGYGQKLEVLRGFLPVDKDNVLHGNYRESAIAIDWPLGDPAHSAACFGYPHVQRSLTLFDRHSPRSCDMLCPHVGKRARCALCAGGF